MRVKLTAGYEMRGLLMAGCGINISAGARFGHLERRDAGWLQNLSKLYMFSGSNLCQVHAD